MSLTRKLFVERLEDRRLLAALAAPWPEVANLTLSFAPDGTLVGNQTSQLFSALDPPLAMDVWQKQILRAMQTWAVESNINIGLVDDGGQPFNSLGFKQGDLRFGDVRIGAFPMGGDVLAVANPYDPFVVNTWVGDIFLNSDYKFDIAGTSGGYDLFSVMLHEAGHIFGIGHSDDPASPMFEHFQNTQTTLAPADIAALQAIYGTRHDDAFDSVAANDRLETASQFPLENDGDGELAADITRSDDVDLYRLDVAAGTSEIDLKLLARGTSLLVGRLSLLDASGQVLASVSVNDPRDNDLSLTYATQGAAGAYFVRVEAASGDVFGVGAYELEYGSELYESVTGESSSKTTDDAQKMSSASLMGAELLATTPGYVEHTYYETESTLSNAHPELMYRVHSVDLGPDLTNVFTVIVDTYGSPNVHVAIYDDQGHVVDATVLAETDDEIALQVMGVRSNVDYFVRVFGDNYAEDAEIEVEVDFAQDSTHWEQLVTGSLAAGEIAAWQTLQVNASQAFHWSLAASDWSQPQATGARLTVYDDQGTAIYTLSADDGSARSGDLFLALGTYTVKFERVSSDIQTPLLFKLSGLSLSDSLGPQLRDTTREPVDSSNRGSAQLSAYFAPGATAFHSSVGFVPPSVASNAPVATSDGMISILATGKIDAQPQPVRANPVVSGNSVPTPAAAVTNGRVDRAQNIEPSASQELPAMADAVRTVVSPVESSPEAPSGVIEAVETSTVAVESPKDVVQPTADEAGVDQFFAASLASDPVILLAAIGGAAWELAVRQRHGKPYRERAAQLVQSVRHRVRITRQAWR